MADELKTRLYIISAAIGLVVTATGAWTTVVVRGTDITANKEVNGKQDVKIEKLEVRTHEHEVAQMQIMTQQTAIKDDINRMQQSMQTIAEHILKE